MDRPYLDGFISDRCWTNPIVIRLYAGVLIVLILMDLPLIDLRHWSFTTFISEYPLLRNFTRVQWEVIDLRSFDPTCVSLSVKLGFNSIVILQSIWHFERDPTASWWAFMASALLRHCQGSTSPKPVDVWIVHILMDLYLIDVGLTPLLFDSRLVYWSSISW